MDLASANHDRPVGHRSDRRAVDTPVSPGAVLRGGSINADPLGLGSSTVSLSGRTRSNDLQRERAASDPSLIARSSQRRRVASLSVLLLSVSRLQTTIRLQPHVSYRADERMWYADERLEMKYIIAVLGLILLSSVLWDAFEVIILPRRVNRRFRFARAFYRMSWSLRSLLGGKIGYKARRENYLSIFGPLSLLMLLSVWVIGLVTGFAMLEWGLGTSLHSASGSSTFSTYLYLSGTTLFTLGLGDVTPLGTLGQAVIVVEAGVGFALLAAVISYLPILYQAFSRREVSISLLDARAGSPPSAGELLRRYAKEMGELRQLFSDWERWSAELLESHLSYPVLGYFRSQHARQSWVAALTAMLDACALVIAGINDGPTRQAQLTFAMARHVVVDLAQIFTKSPWVTAPDRLPPSKLEELRHTLAEAGISMHNGVVAEEKLRELRQMYEPYAHALSNYFLMPLPPWFRVDATLDSWQSSPSESVLPQTKISSHSSKRSHR